MKTKICSYCGKSFIVYSTYMYKTKKDGKIQYQCCYSCYRKEGGDTWLYNRRSKPIDNKNIEVITWIGNNVEQLLKRS